MWRSEAFREETASIVLYNLCDMTSTWTFLKNNATSIKVLPGYQHTKTVISTRLSYSYAF